MTNHLYDTIFAGHETSTKAFLIDERGEVSYQAFLQRVNQLANALKASGLKDGDRVAVQAQKSLMFEDANRMRDGEGGDSDLNAKRSLDDAEERRMLVKAIGEYSESISAIFTVIIKKGFNALFLNSSSNF